MGQAVHPQSASSSVLDVGLLQLALAYRAADYQFQAYRQAHGLDAQCSRMLDDVSQKKKLMFAVLDTIVDEVLASTRAEGPEDSTQDDPRDEIRTRN